MFHVVGCAHKIWEVRMDKLLIRPGEVAEMLGLSRSRVYALLAQRELPSVRLGNSVRVEVTALRKWLEERAAGSPGAR